MRLLHHPHGANCHWFILALLAAFIIGPSSAAKADTPSSISVTYCSECVPFEFTNADGGPDGQIADYWRLWSKKTGIDVRFVPATWNQTLSNIANGDVDAHAGLFFSKDRSAYLDYGSALTDTDTHVFFHEDIAFPQTRSELKAYKIAVVSGDFVEGWLKEHLGEASVIGFEDYPSIMAALHSGEIKLFAADTRTALYHLGRSDLLTKFRHERLKPLYTSKWFVAVKKGNRALLDVINDGMSKISGEERLRIARTWASGTRSEDPDSVIVAIDSYYPPLSSMGIDGSPQGLMVDLWREWGKAVGRLVRFKAGNWKQTLDDVRTGEADIHSGLFKSEEREQWLAFSQPLQAVKTGIFTKSDSAEGKSLAALQGKRVAAVTGTYQARYIEEQHPGIDLHKVATRTDYLMALLRGDVVAIIEEVPTIDAALAKFGLTGSVSRRVELFENQVFAGVRKDNRAMLDLVNRGFDRIPRERLAEIEKRWVVNPEDRFFSEQEGVARLSNAEKEWVAAHPTITIAATPDWPPFEWQDERTGRHRGISADFLKLAAAKVGLRLAPEFGPWTPLVEKLKNKQIDVAPGLNRTPNRQKFLLFTEPFTEYFSVIFTATERDDIKSMADLDGKTVAVEKGYALAEILARDYPKIRLKPVDTTLQALQAVSANEVDAFVGNQLVGTYLVKKYLVANVATTGFYDSIPGRLRFGVRDDWPILRTILDKGLAAITEDERNRIIRTHIGLRLDMGKHVRLTDKERDWLNGHRTVRLGVDSSWPPFEYLDDEGVYSGLAAGYVEALSKRLDITMIPKPELTWSEAIKAIEKGGGIDILPAVAITPARRKFLNFTKPYLSFPLVIATRKDAPYVGGLSDLNGKRVGVIRDYYTHEMLRTNHPEIIPVFSGSVAEGLELLEKGETAAFFDNLAVITYEQTRLGLEDIKIAAPTKYKAELSIGVRKDWPELVPILDKALATLDEKERTAIKNTWLAVRVSFGWDIETILIWAAPIGGSALLIIAFVVVWNRRLGAEVNERKRAEEEARIARDVAEEATKAKATFLATMSHEIRTPMGGVIGMVDLLRQSKMTDDQRQMIDTVGDSAHSLLTIINDILDFSKIEAGKLDLEEIPISIRDVVEGAGEALAVNARNKHIVLSVYVDPDIPDALVGDQVRLRQILFNFGSNAVKFTDKGRVLIRADRLPSAAGERITVRFQVIDEGIGIPKEAQEKLFQAFTQVEASTTRRFGGTGLGLSICQRLTELMNGEIAVDSVPGEGATFSATISLPIAAEHTIKSDGHDLGGLNILFVHREDDMRELFPRYLERWGATVSAGGDIEGTRSLALDAIERGRPFDVICVGSGWSIGEQIETVERLQAEQALSSTRYVITCRDRDRTERKELDDTVYVDSGPLRRALFIRTVAVAVGRASPVVEQDEHEVSRRSGKAPTVEQAEAMGQLILLAEDNLTNQDVIGRQLTMLGYAFVIANDGREALELLGSRSFAILLTDCHMPNMDGFELAETIRTSEEGKDGRFPIIAITASVMKEEIDHCFAAGMDDYLPKPLEMAKLEEMLGKWLPASDLVVTGETSEATIADTTVTSEASGGDGSPIDPSALKDVFGDDEETFVEILREFVGPATSNAEEIEAAFGERSADGVANGAHKLKSSARSVGAHDLADLCQGLETAGKAANWDEIDRLAPRIPGTVQRVVEYINDL